GDGSLRGQIEQVLLLPVELGEFGIQLSTQQFGCPLLIGHDLGHLGSDCGGERRREAQGRVVPLHGLLDGVEVDVGRAADVLLATATEEVEVLVSATPSRPLDDETRLAASGTAGSTPKGALEVVMVDPLPLAACGLGIENALYPVE